MNNHKSMVDQQNTLQKANERIRDFIELLPDHQEKDELKSECMSILKLTDKDEADYCGSDDEESFCIESEKNAYIQPDGIAESAYVDAKVLMSKQNQAKSVKATNVNRITE